MPDPNDTQGQSQGSANLAAPDTSAQAPAPQPVAVPGPPAPAPGQVVMPPPSGAHSRFGQLFHAVKNNLESQHGYEIDPESGKMNPVPARPGSAWRNLISAALTGLAAGGAAPEKKSAVANIASGLGIGAEAVEEKQLAKDKLARAQAAEDFERQQQLILQKHNIAHLNAVTTATYFHMQREQQEMMQPEYDSNKALEKSFIDSQIPVQEMTAQEAARMAKADPNFMATHIIKPIGMVPENGPDGRPVMNADGTPGMHEMVFVGSGMHDGSIKVPGSLAADVQKYGKLAGIINPQGIQEGSEVPMKNFVSLLGSIQAAKKQELQGWISPQTVYKEDGTPMQKNPFAPEGEQIRPFPPGVTPISPEEQQKIATEKAKEQEAKASAFEKKTAAKLNQAYAAQIAGGAGGGAGTITDELKTAVAALPAPVQAQLQAYPPSIQQLLIRGAHGWIAPNTFPERLTKGGIGITRANAESIMLAINPNYSSNLFSTIQGVQKDYVTGKEGQAIRSFGQFLVHSADLADVSKEFQRTNSPWLNTPINEIRNKGMGQPGVPRMMTAIEAARQEWQSFIDSGYKPDQAQSERGNILMSDKSNPSQIMGVLNVMGDQAVGRLDQLNESYKTATGEDYPNLIPPMAKDAAIQLGLGQKIQKYRSGGNYIQATKPLNIPSEATHIGKDAQGNIVGYVLNGQWVDTRGK